MAQRFQELQISSEEPLPSTSRGSQYTCSEINSPISMGIDDSNAERRLVVAEEIKRLKEEPILPSSLLSKL